MSWNPSVDQQAQDRAYRYGQEKEVSVYRLVSKGTVEEVIYMRQLYKQTLQTNILDSHSATVQNSVSIHKNGDKKQREFEGIQGVRSAQGELFGLNNLMQHTDVSILHSLRQKYPCQSEDHENEKKVSKSFKRLAALNLDLLPETEVMGLLKKDLDHLEIEESHNANSDIDCLPPYHGDTAVAEGEGEGEGEGESSGSRREVLENSEAVPMKANIGYSNILQLIGCSSKDAQLHDDILREQPALPTQMLIGQLDGNDDDDDDDDDDDLSAVDDMKGDGEKVGGTGDEEDKGSKGVVEMLKEVEEGGGMETSISVPTAATTSSSPTPAISTVKKRVLPNSIQSRT